MIERSRILLALAALLAAPLAGCLGAAVENDVPLARLADAQQTFKGQYTWQSPLAYDALSGSPVEATPVLTDVGALPVAVEMLVGGAGAEPNLGVTSSGAIFVTTYDQTRRSTDHGFTWEIVHDLITPQAPTTEDMLSTSDPMLWVDTDTDRVFANHMHPALLCSWLAWSDDDGETWTDRPMACGVPYVDHQKIMTAPPGPNTPPTVPAGVLYPNVFYFCVNKIELGTWCAVSLDGGATFAYDRDIYAEDQRCSNVNGHPAAFPDGTVAVALGSLGDYCDRPLTIIVTEDSGLTWEARQCAPEYGQAEIDADITVTPDGTAYILFRHENELAYLARSTDKFRTCDVFRVSPADHTINAFAGITSGDDGRIAMAYLGTTSAQRPNPGPSNATPGSIWHLYVTTSFDAASENPTFVTQQVTPDEDPIQVGCVWFKGGGGGPYRCRNLLDFIDMVRDDEGRYYVAITDGCVPRNGCTGTPEQSDFQSRDRQIAVAIQDRGMSLFAEKGILPSLGLQWPEPLPPRAEPADGG